MHVLVTGGCGYIGSVLVGLLQDAPNVEEVSVLDSLSTGSPLNLVGARVTDAFSFRQGDVREYGDVEAVMRDVDTVVHLAAITGAESTHDREAETRAVNYDGTRNVLNAAEKLDVGNVVFASSCNVYGRATEENITETTDAEPINPYAQAKLDAEDLLGEFAEVNGGNATVLRMSTNYGYAPGVRFNLVVNHFVFRALTDRPLTVYGDGSNWRPFVHVRDAAGAFANAACNPGEWPQLVYNVGANDENYRISEIAEIVREEVDPELDLTYLEDEHPGPSYHVNFDRLAETGFEPEWTLREGVRELAERFEEANGDEGVGIER
jgi:UDP-glucose 4-epimerase